ncbi:hypothetical protein T4D_14200 [Trichinella pseudospiralis]|uniref:Uncharacterized protein n=1 Tax=Trichinella pseudospiralis TaxID=6337 RepID=A0A0V1F422_TRIPS|nr:hypothetical protein T4D_14200 [Trichinella pseudospiralis]
MSTGEVIINFFSFHLLCLLRHVEHICSKDKETEEYLDELKGLAESLSDGNDVTNVDMLSEEMKNKRFSIPTSIAEMNVFVGLLSVAGIFHENHKNPGNYGVSIKLQEEVHIWQFCLNMKPA